MQLSLCQAPTLSHERFVHPPEMNIGSRRTWRLSTGHPQPGCEAALAPICIVPTLPQPHEQPAESMVSQVDSRGFYLQSFSHLKHEHRHLCTGSSRTAVARQCRVFWPSRCGCLEEARMAAT